MFLPERDFNFGNVGVPCEAEYTTGSTLGQGHTSFNSHFYWNKILHNVNLKNVVPMLMELIGYKKNSMYLYYLY